MDRRLISEVSFMNIVKPVKAVHFRQSSPNLDDVDENEDEELQNQPEKVKSRHSTRAAMFGGGVGTVRDVSVASAHPFIVFPWTRRYKIFWSFTVVAAIFTLFFETFMVAFEEPGLAPYNGGSAGVECVIMAIYTIDIIVNFNLAYYNDREELIYDRKQIATNYVRTRLWKDILGVFPFYAVLLAATGQMGSDGQTSQYLSLVRLVRMITLHRLKLLFEILQFNSRISLTFLTLLRNFFFTFVWVHFWACVMYFIAKKYDFDPDNTAIGSAIQEGMTIAERYILVLYYTIVTFTTVGYGDFSPVNAAEQVFNMVYMFLNILFMAWIIGSITLLVVKSDQKTGAYRELLSTVDDYARLNNFKPDLKKRLKTQLKLNFNNQDISDEHVLSHFPSSTRRRILRQLYMSSLIKTTLLEGVRVQFLDELLASCKVEMFGPGEELLQRGCVATDLFLLVGGKIELINYLNEASNTEDGTPRTGSSHRSSSGDSEMHRSKSGSVSRIGPGDFINEISFFTGTPQIDTIRTVAICKTLTISRSAYKMITDDHPGTAMKILRNLLTKVETIASHLDFDQRVNLPKSLPVLQAGSVYDISGQCDDSLCGDVNHAIVSIQTENTLSTVRDLVRMHMEKVNDDHTTRFLFAGSRGDLKVITLMCDQGFDPNEADYDNRTALMVASVQGNTAIVKKLLSYEGIDPNKTDIHGNTALYEAVKCGHDNIIEVLMEHGASLCMDDKVAASTLCQVVSNGDIITMKRLLKAKIQVNAGDYDQRTAIHIAASEGNVVALKLLVEHGADLSVRDRWGNSILDEAKRSQSGQLLDYLKSFGDLFNK